MLIRYTAFCLLGFSLTSTVLVASAAKPTSKLNLGHVQVQGNPLGRHDDYTINGVKSAQIAVACVLTNMGAKSVDLNIWTRPNAKHPRVRLHLNPGSQAKPTELTLHLDVSLKPHWWCRIYTPNPASKTFANCSYFSVSDATIVDYVPFSNFDKTIHSKDSHYSCNVVDPKSKKMNKAYRFFYFK